MTDEATITTLHSVSVLTYFFWMASCLKEKRQDSDDCLDLSCIQNTANVCKMNLEDYKQSSYTH